MNSIDRKNTWAQLKQSSLSKWQEALIKQNIGHCILHVNARFKLCRYTRSVQISYQWHLMTWILETNTRQTNRTENNRSVRHKKKLTRRRNTLSPFAQQVKGHCEWIRNGTHSHTNTTVRKSRTHFSLRLFIFSRLIKLFQCTVIQIRGEGEGDPIFPCVFDHTIFNARLQIKFKDMRIFFYAGNFTRT